MEITSKGNFENISYGVTIVTRRINEDYVRRYAHMPATGYGEQIVGRVFQASNSGFLTSESQRLIVQYPENY